MPSKRKIEEIEVTEFGASRSKKFYDFESPAETNTGKRSSSRLSKQNQLDNDDDGTTATISDILDAVQVNASIARLSFSATKVCSTLQAQVLEIVAGKRSPNDLSRIRQQVSTHLANLELEATDSLIIENGEEDIPRSETLDAVPSENDLVSESDSELESESADDDGVDSNGPGSVDIGNLSSMNGMGTFGTKDIKNKPKIIDLDKINSPGRPNIQAPKSKDRVRSALLMERLKDFMPKMEKSMVEMEQKRRTGTLKVLDAEDVEGEDRVIEMNLGLGVLEEKEPLSSTIDGIALKDDEQDETEDVGWEEMLANVVGMSRNTDVRIEEVGENGAKTSSQRRKETSSAVK